MPTRGNHRPWQRRQSITLTVRVRVGSYRQGHDIDREQPRHWRLRLPDRRVGRRPAPPEGVAGRLRRVVRDEVADPLLVGLRRRRQHRRGGLPGSGLHRAHGQAQGRGDRRLVDLLGQQPRRDPRGAARHRPVRERRRPVLRRRGARRPRDPGALHLVAHHRGLRPLGAGVLARRRGNLGGQLDRRVHPRRRRPKRRTAPVVDRRRRGRETHSKPQLPESYSRRAKVPDRTWS